MSNALSQKSCKPCEGGGDPLTPKQVLHFMAETPLWQSDPDVTMIARTFDCENFQKAVAFVNRVANLAEEEGHHPNIHIHDFRNVTLSLSTHAIGGLSENDFILAAKIDAL